MDCVRIVQKLEDLNKKIFIERLNQHEHVKRIADGLKALAILRLLGGRDKCGNAPIFHKCIIFAHL